MMVFSFLESLPVSLDIQSALEQGLQGDRLKKKNSHPQLKNTKNQLQDQSLQNSKEHHLFSIFQFWNWEIAQSHLQVGHSTKAHSCFLAGLRSPAFLQKLEGTCGRLW